MESGRITRGKNALNQSISEIQKISSILAGIVPAAAERYGILVVSPSIRRIVAVFLCAAGFGVRTAGFLQTSELCQSVAVGGRSVMESIDRLRTLEARTY
uniref:Uncharacterized protein n=1 Tax=Caenorhabditis japonica TaxID=281687 RepID=A0A8R1IL61_CAEJA